MVFPKMIAAGNPGVPAILRDLFIRGRRTVSQIAALLFTGRFLVLGLFSLYFRQDHFGRWDDANPFPGKLSDLFLLVEDFFFWHSLAPARLSIGLKAGWGRVDVAGLPSLQ